MNVRPRRTVFASFVGPQARHFECNNNEPGAAMNIHEYQAKELLAKFGVPVPAGYAAMTVDEAVEAAGKLPGPLWVVKSQIHAGGRGKGKFKELPAEAKGGVRLARSLDEVRAAATDMLG